MEKAFLSIWLAGSSLISSSPSQARALKFKLELDRAWPNLQLSIVEPTNTLEQRAKMIIKLRFNHFLAQKSSIELWKIGLFTSSLKSGSNFELEPRLGPTSNFVQLRETSHEKLAVRSRLIGPNKQKNNLVFSLQVLIRLSKKKKIWKLMFFFAFLGGNLTFPSKIETCRYRSSFWLS